MNITRIIISVFLLVLQLQAVAAQDIKHTSNNKINDSAVKKTKPDQAVKIKQPSTVIKWTQVGKIPGLIDTGKLNIQQIPNPHWRDDACLTCHTKNGKQASVRNLRAKNSDAGCSNCHDARFDHSYIHPVNVKVGAIFKGKIDPQFKRTLKKTGGKVSCVTCHDLSKQCLSKNKKEQSRNPLFYRGGPFKNRSDQCFLCHDDKKYQRLNPHEQIDDNGKLRENTCKICHPQSVEKLKKAKSIKDVKFHLNNNLEKMCWGCHKYTPHPGGQFTFFSSDKGPNHLVVPSEKTSQRLKKMTSKHQVYMPLEPGSGRVFCGTCHNPHEKGVIKNPQAAKGAGEKKGLRVQNICQYCHLK